MQCLMRWDDICLDRVDAGRIHTYHICCGTIYGSVHNKYSHHVIITMPAADDDARWNEFIVLLDHHDVDMTRQQAYIMRCSLSSITIDLSHAR